MPPVTKLSKKLSWVLDLRFTKEGSLTREFSSIFKPTSYPFILFSPVTPSPRGFTQLPLSTALYAIRTGGVRGDNSIVYDFYALAARWTVHAKIYILRILTYLYNLWIHCVGYLGGVRDIKILKNNNIRIQINRRGQAVLHAVVYY